LKLERLRRLVLELAQVIVPSLMLDDHEFIANRFLRVFEPRTKSLRITYSSRQRNNRARSHQKKLLPDQTILFLPNTMDFIEDNASDTARPGILRLRVRGSHQHDLQDMRYSDQDLTSRWVIDAVISSMNTPYRSSILLQIFREACLDFGGDLIDQGFCRRDVD
jgi:hypothetical protein